MSKGTSPRSSSIALSALFALALVQLFVVSIATVDYLDEARAQETSQSRLGLQHSGHEPNRTAADGGKQQGDEAPDASGQSERRWLGE